MKCMHAVACRLLWTAARSLVSLCENCLALVVFDHRLMVTWSEGQRVLGWQNGTFDLHPACYLQEPTMACVPFGSDVAC
jgi:hypothetical protein